MALPVSKKPVIPGGNIEIAMDATEESLLSSLVRTFQEALKLSLELFKVMVPVLIAVEILQHLDLIRYLAMPLVPVMEMVGLPPEMGLVWATAMFNNLYGAMVVFLSLIKQSPMTQAQATVICTMMLVAHSLPVELRIAQASGPRLLFQTIMRTGSASLLGWLLHIFYSGFDLLQAPVNILLSQGPQALPGPRSPSLWAWRELQSLFSIFLIIQGLFLLMRLLERIRAIDLMNRLLRPLLKLIGIGPKASAIAVIGLTMGISYGGGIIIHESRSGRIHRKDVFYALTFMGLSHALIEDTLLMVALGGDLSGVLIARLIFSLVAVSLMVKIIDHFPEDLCDRFFWGNAM